jgi:alkanesulfonate monooxygenase SsuD/methylene tetrahydromethanopterin reductase-like flavin-dependent oxidoreductase (luciferase family)
VRHRQRGGRHERAPSTGTTQGRYRDTLAPADAITGWFDAGAADGFDIMAAVLPSGLEAFVDHVVPIPPTRHSSGSFAGVSP